ncbi:uncharacterized protein C9orf152-like [Pungitius pungitius]|uniref:uncharacterized protein C9orf152-like n=1 Tax=Pungitius pungitius TaxID=134920 RepID=UPI002E121923
MDVSLLREQYRCSREEQRRHVLLRTVSEELSEAVTQGLALPWEPLRGLPGGVTFDPDATGCGDPWRAHLDLHFLPGVTAESSPETTRTDSSFRRSSSSSETRSTTDEVNADRSRGEPGQSGGSRGDHPPGSDERSAPTSSLFEDLKEEASVLQTSCKAPALRFTRQLSLGGVDSSNGVHQNQNHHPFPNRKPPRISEAAKRLGMYSSF